MTPVLAWSSVQRAVAARRRPVAALLAGLAVLCGLAALRPPGPATELVLAAARDLPSGTALALADLRAVALPAAAVPSGALRPGAAVLGRLVAGPVRRGEPLTDVRLVGPGLLGALAPGSVAVPVRFADAGAVALLRPGDRIDVLAAPPEGYAGAGPPEHAADPARAPERRPDAPAPPAPPDRDAEAARPAGAAAPAARAVAADVVVLSVPTTEEPAYGDGALVVVACSPAVARALAAASAYARLSPALRAAGP